MTTIKNTMFLLLLLLTASGAYCQTQIDGDLLLLSELAISKSPIIQTNELEIDRAEANLRAQRSSFDYQLSAGTNLNKNTLTLFDADPRKQLLSGELESKTTQLSLGLQKRFRTGLLAEFSTNYSRISDNFPLNRFSEDIGANVSDHATSATIALTQPLLRGNGLKVVTAFEKSAKLDIESANENYELNNAFEISQVGTAYWNYLSFFKSLEIYKENENRVRNVLQITEELVKADKKPQSDLVQIKADLAQQERQTAVAEQNLYRARANLGRVVGMSEEDSKNIGNPINEFPSPLESQFDPDKNVKSLITLARENRSDIKAQENTQHALELQLSAFKNDVLPQLDLGAFFTHGGAAVGGGLEQFFNALNNRQGRNHTSGLTLTFSLPVNNNLAKANLAKSKIALKNQKIRTQNLLRNIDLNVGIAYNNLNNNVLILEKAMETLNYYQEVFNNERVKFQNGMTTLLNLILFQERLTFAHLDYVSAQRQFATSLIDLRFETGTLIAIDENRLTAPINRSAFYTIPSNN